LAGFAGELIILIGVYQAGYVWAVIVALIAIVAASAYMLRLYQDIMNGPPVEDVPVRPDLSWREALAVAPLLAALVAVGVYPAPLLGAHTAPVVTTSSRTP
jgi:NADH-quinone oxidoreductase subunit M